MSYLFPKWLYPPSRFNKRININKDVNGYPSDLTATTIGETSIDIEWTNGSTNEDGIIIERSRNGATYGVVGTVAKGITSFSNSGLIRSTLYYYRIRAYKGTNYSNYSNILQITTIGE